MRIDDVLKSHGVGVGSSKGKKVLDINTMRKGDSIFRAGTLLMLDESEGKCFIGNGTTSITYKENNNVIATHNVNLGSKEIIPYHHKISNTSYFFYHTGTQVGYISYNHITNTFYSRIIATTSGYGTFLLDGDIIYVVYFTGNVVLRKYSFIEGDISEISYTTDNIATGYTLTSVELIGDRIYSFRKATGHDTGYVVIYDKDTLAWELRASHNTMSYHYNYCSNRYVSIDNYLYVPHGASTLSAYLLENNKTMNAFATRSMGVDWRLLMDDNKNIYYYRVINTMVINNSFDYVHVLFQKINKTTLEDEGQPFTVYNILRGSNSFSSIADAFYRLNQRGIIGKADMYQDPGITNNFLKLEKIL